MNPPFAVQKIGHAVVNVIDLEASKRFYTDVLGFRISDVYEGNKMPGGMVFLRCNGDHHCLALIGGAAPAARSRSSSSILTAITWSSIGASTRSATTAARGRRRSGVRR